MKNAIFRIPVWVMAVLLLTGGFAFAGSIDLLSETLPTGEFDGVVFSATMAYCAAGYGVTVIDFSDPTNPDPITILPTDGLCQGVALNTAGTYLYVADGFNGL